MRTRGGLLYAFLSTLCIPGPLFAMQREGTPPALSLPSAAEDFEAADLSWPATKSTIARTARFTAGAGSANASAPAFTEPAIGTIGHDPRVARQRRVCSADADAVTIRPLARASACLTGPTHSWSGGFDQLRRALPGLPGFSEHGTGRHSPYP
jgi:hypothetical protein